MKRHNVLEMVGRGNNVIARAGYTASTARAMMRGRGPHNPPSGFLVAQCWCGRYCVAVPTERVRACLTESCGHPECGPS